MEERFRFESILESISGGFLALDRDFRIIYWNRAVAQGTGLTSDEVLGRSVFDVFPNAEGAMPGAKYRQAMETGMHQSFENCYRDSRYEVWYDVSVYPADHGLSVFLQDITKKKRDQRQKEILVDISRAINSSQHLDELCIRAAEKIALLFDVPVTCVTVFLFDPKTDEIRLVAPASLDLDFPPGLVHQHVTERADRAAAYAAFRREPVVTVRVEEATVAGLLRDEIEHRDLKTLLVMPLLVQGDLQGVIEVLSIREKAFIDEDVETLGVVANELAAGMSRRRLLDELRMKNLELEAQTRKTEEASETLKKFLATFSHELRSPLNSIIGFSDVICTQIDNLPSASLQEFMKNINISGRHLQHIINDILDLSKIEAGRLDLHVASYPVSYFEDAVRGVLSGLLTERTVTLEFHLSPEFDEIVVDQTRFKQVLINLASNAVKFSHPGGTVTISSQRVGNDLQFEVRDQGIGISATDIPSLFTAFRQARTGTGLNVQGIGLGLAITKKLVELHGGSIWIESEQGEGTTVFVRIPLIVDVSSEQIMKSGMLLEALRRENYVRAPGEKPLALIVEDGAQAGELLKLYVESAGYAVEIARDGAEAFEKAKRLHPSVITLDLMLPVKDGWQVLKELKAHPLCKHIPIIIVSIIDEKSLGFSLGAVDYFVKPVNKDDLVKALDRVHLLPGDRDHRPTVLVIDDDKTAIDLVHVILENEGYDVLKATHGREGIEMALRVHPDLIILDLVMPEMSGLDVAYELKHIPATRSIPIIILTSMDVEPEMQGQLSAYVSGLMSKSSFTKRDLLREIANIENTR